MFSAVVLACAISGWASENPGPAPGALPPLERSHWIWSRNGEDVCEVRKIITLAQPAKAASVLITADNGYDLYVNGTFIGNDVGAAGDVWQSVERYDIISALAPGKNVIGIRGTDLGGLRGVIAALRIEFTNAPATEAVTDGTWRTAAEGDPKDYSHPEFIETAQWSEASVLGPFGIAPWGKLAWSEAAESRRRGAAAVLTKPANDFQWPGSIAFLANDASVYVPLRGDAWGVCFRIGDWSRAYTEFDLPCPSKIGRKLHILRPGPHAVSRILFDAGAGVIGSPSASFDGKSLLIAMAREGEKFFHIYRIPVAGGAPQRLTDGTFHDIDPAELPDGRIVFASTRIGTFEEYHSPPSRALFVMNADGSDIHPITFTPIFDNEPKVLADGRIVFIRSDNFFDRAKVETHLHVIRPDGTDGLTEVGADVGADYGVRLRVLGYGSPAPLPNGRLAFISNRGNFICSVGGPEQQFHRLPDQLAEVAPLPDNRLLATVLRGRGTRSVSDVIAVVDPRDNQVVPIFESAAGPVHSPVYLGERPRPPVIPEYVSRTDSKTQRTGFLFCQDARFTRKTKADWGEITAIRVVGAIPLTTRSSHSHIVHAGHETVELGTVPIAPDGSFHIEVPADMPLALQAVDAEGRSELNEMSWIYVRPGEHRSCIGCHQQRQTAPPQVGRSAQALRAPPVTLVGQGDPHRFRGNNSGVTGMMDLQFERFRECASLNLHSASADPLTTSHEQVRRLISQLEGSEAGARISAAQRLAIFRERSAAPALAGSLRDGSREVRIAAALALAACGTRESVPPLLSALEDLDPVVAASAIMALRNLVGSQLTPFDPFADLAQRSVAARTCRAWFETHSWAAIENDLVQRLRPGSPESRRRAVVALGHIGADAARAALREFVRHSAEKNPYPRFERDNRTDAFTFPADSPWNPRTSQEAIRSLGYLRDEAALPLLAELLTNNIEPATANLFVAESAIEALGRVGTREAEDVLLSVFAKLKHYWEYVGWYSDHPALYACHSSPLHARLIQALNGIGSTRCARLAGRLIESVPTDPDRALFPQNDDYENGVGALLRRSGRGAEVVETCLAILGDAQAQPADDIKQAIATTHAAWAGKPDPENRAAQILSLACRDRSYEPRVRAAFARFRDRAEEPIKRELGNPTWTPIRHWVLFYLGRSLANLGDSRSVDILMAALSDALTEARHGRPDPASPEIHFLQLDYTPCWRAAAAFALGRIREPRAAPTLLRVVQNFDNAPDVRHAAAQALNAIHDPGCLAELQKIAAHYPELSTRRLLRAACTETQSAASTQLATGNPPH